METREIKFRALTKNNNVMVFGDLILCPNYEHRILWFEIKGELPLDIDYDSFNEVVKSNTIGQFTGLKDKKGKDIYVGDFVSVKGMKKIGIYNTEIIECSQGYTLKENKTYLNDDKCFVAILEVLGNIHETN